jgi:hypothetical protein
MRAALLLLVACGSSRAKPTTTELRPIESVPGLAQKLPDGAKVDCRLSSFARTRFAKQQVVPCGAVTHASGLPAWEQTGTCLADALTKRLPVIAEHSEQGTDSDFLMATVGVRVGNDYVVYRLSADSDPCGGDCPLKGGVAVERCTDLLSPKFGCNGADCAGCGRWEREEPCNFNGPQKPETVEDVLGS